MALRTARLVAALDTLAADPSPARIVAAQRMWIGARQAWELTEAFGFGPAHAAAGQPGSVYATGSAGIAEVMAGIADPPDEVATSKIATPLAAQGADAVHYQESRFSDNTLANLTDNIVSARALYLGVDPHTALALPPGASPPGAPGGVRALVLATIPALDAQVRDEFAAALTALAAAGPNFGTALLTNRAAVAAAQRAILRLRDTLLTRVARLVGTIGDTA